jgi:hypothetical protein
VCRADAQVGHPACPVRLIRHLGYDHLRSAGPGGRSCRARQEATSTTRAPTRASMRERREDAPDDLCRYWAEAISPWVLSGYTT